MTNKTANENYQVSRQHVQVTVNALRKKGLLESGPNPSHKRSVLMKLSETGGELFAEILAKDKETVERLFSAVSPEDQKTTRRTLVSCQAYSVGFSES